MKIEEINEALESTVITAPTVRGSALIGVVGAEKEESSAKLIDFRLISIVF